MTGEPAAALTFGIFDHIEGMAGTSMHQLLQQRLELIRLADAAGFRGYYLAEHHGSDLCLAPNQEIFLAAAAQATRNIRLAPMVKILPIHHPLRVIEDICLLDQLTGGRLEYGVGRGIAAIEHFWFDGDWSAAHDRFSDALALIVAGLRTGRVTTDASKYWSFPPIDVTLTPYQQPNPPFWYPGNPGTAGRYGLNLMWPGAIDASSYDAYLSAWEANRGGDVRADGPGSRPKVGSVQLLGVAETEKEAKDIAKRGWRGLFRRIGEVHKLDALALGDKGAEEALNPRARAAAAAIAPGGEPMLDQMAVNSGTPAQVTERLGAIVAEGRCDEIVLQLPTGDMTFEESRRSLQLFISDVMPALQNSRATVGAAGS